MIRTSLLLTALLAVAACQREAAPPAAAPPTTAQPTRAANPLQPSGAARLDGHGDVRFGMTAAEVQQGARMALHRTAENGICYFLTPASAPVAVPIAYMVEADKFVRYDVMDGHDAAPGGGKSGMSVEQIEQLYPGQARERPAGGNRSLRVDAGQDVAIVFEVGADGRVSRWRVGQVPQVDYTHGCS